MSILTPVYDGEKYLAECIESVLTQTYQNWEYWIVNNCSTDKTLEIAQNYAKKDNRIKVVSNHHFVGAVENHNIAFGLMSSQSKYCKVVSADDWIYPECVTKLVDVAERIPSVGIVGSYSINANGVRWPGLPHDTTVFSGRQICRLYLLGKIGFFATPSTVLYRSILVKSRRSFFPGSAPHADAAACLICLQVSDFAFVHQVLSFERIHEAAMTTRIRVLDSFELYPLDFLAEFGPIFLTHEELKHRKEELLRDYYKFLALGFFNFRNKEFWNYHRRRLEHLGYPFYSIGLANAFCMKLLDLLLNPKQTIEKTVRRINPNRHKLNQKN